MDALCVALERAGASLVELDACLSAAEEDFSAAAQWLVLPQLPPPIDPFARALGLKRLPASGVVLPRPQATPAALDQIPDTELERLVAAGLVIWAQGLNRARAALWQARLDALTER